MNVFDMGNLSKKISIIFKLKKEIKNWKIPILYYFGLRKKEAIIEFKNGIKCIIRNKSDSIAFLEVFFLNTNDFWRDYNEMKKKGVEFVRDPSSQDYGTVAVFKDLYGNLWDLLQLNS